jgi:hypothetical protein
MTMNEQDLKKYNYLWDGADPGWVLLKAPELAGGLCIYNKRKQALLHIESSDLNAALCEQLKKKGVEILGNVLPGEVVVKPRK